jgi:glycosyltransferase involved in cell wall biosynthesis
MLAAADVLVQPGWPGPFDDERIPSKLPEFFAMSRPVILPRTNLGLRVAHEQEAYVLDRADAEGMAEAIWRLKADPALRQRLAGNAAYYAIREFCDVPGRETAALYQWYQRF